jgi:hypothetical protein
LADGIGIDSENIIITSIEEVSDASGTRRRMLTEAELRVNYDIIVDDDQSAEDILAA